MSLTESVRYLIDAEDLATAKIRKHEGVLRKFDRDTKKRSDRAARNAQSIIGSTKTELERIKDKIKAVRAYGQTSARAAAESQQALSRLIVLHKKEVAAIKEKADAIKEGERQAIESARKEAAALLKTAEAERKAKQERGRDAAIGAAGQFGGVLGETSSGVASLISDFNSLAEVGGKAGLAIKAGMVGATAVISFKLGKAIGDRIFQTKRWNDEIRKNTEELTYLGSLADRIITRSGDRQFEGIKLIADPAKQEAALKRLTSTLEKDIKGTKRKVEAAQAELASASFEGYLWDASEEAKANQQVVIENAKRLLAIRRSQLDRVQDETSEYKKQLALRRKMQGLVEAFDDYVDPIKEEVLQLELGNEEYQRRKDIVDALRLSHDKIPARLLDIKRLNENIAEISKLQSSSEFIQIRRLQKKRSELKAIAEAEKKADDDRKKREEKTAQARKKAADDAKKAAADRLRQEQRIADQQGKAIEGIKLQLIESAKGKAAAEAFRLKQIGFSREEANGLARLKDQIGKLKESASKTTINVGNNTAKDDRLLNGRAQSSFAKTAEAIEAERQTKIQEAMKSHLAKLVEFERNRKNQPPLQAVGR